MNPAEFPQQNVVYAKDQPEYLPLPVYRRPDGQVTSCWRLDWRERLVLLITGRLWLDILTFNHPLQPIRPYVEEPEFTSEN